MTPPNSAVAAKLWVACMGGRLLFPPPVEVIQWLGGGVESQLMVSFFPQPTAAISRKGRKTRGPTRAEANTSCMLSRSDRAPARPPCGRFIRSNPEHHAKDRRAGLRPRARRRGGAGASDRDPALLHA